MVVQVNAIAIAPAQLQVNAEHRFRRCSVQSTLRMAPLNLCFYILLYVFLLSLFTRITSALFKYDSGPHYFFHGSRTDRAKSIGEPLLPQSIKKYQKLHPVINSMSFYQSVIPDMQCNVIQKGLSFFIIYQSNL